MKARVPSVLYLAAGLALSGVLSAADTPAGRLSEEDRKWLESYVAPIILPEEKKLFLELTEPYQREAFQEDFWARREKEGLGPPLGPGYRYRYEELRRLADEKYDGWRQDAGRMVIRWGEPSDIWVPKCMETFRGDLEIWTYNLLEPQQQEGVAAVLGSRQKARFIFHRVASGVPRKMWVVGARENDIFQPNSCRKSLEGLSSSCSYNAMDPCALCQDLCEVYKVYVDMKSRQGFTGGGIEIAKLLDPPVVSTEGLDQQKKKWATLPTPDAKPLTVEGPSGVVAASNAAFSTPAIPASIPELSAREREERLKALPEEDRKWIEEYVAPIVLPAEKNLFLQLTAPHQREAFREEFWKRREEPGLPRPLGPGYRHRYASYRELAVSQYGGLTSDAGRLVVRKGEPDGVEALEDCANTFREVEVWSYAKSSGVLQGATYYLFYRTSPGGPRRLWYPAVPETELMAPASCLSSFEAACLASRAANPSPSTGVFCAGNVARSCASACELSRIAEKIRAERGADYPALDVPPRVNLEGLPQLAARFAISPDPSAKPLTPQPAGETAVVPTSPSAKVSAGPATRPAPARQKLSRKEEKVLTEKLPQKYKDFLHLVSLIITPDEVEVFLQIDQNYQRDRFIEQFWKRRSFDTQGLRTNFQAVFTRRVAEAMELFRNLYNERSKVYVINGPPDAVIPIDCPEVYVPLQIWFYERIEALKSKVYLIFYQPMSMGDYKLWLPLDGQGALMVGIGAGPAAATAARPIDVQRCFEWRTVNQAMSYVTAILGSGAFGMQGASKLFEPPSVETEGVDQILSMTTDMREGATALQVAKLVRFPELRANKIGMDLSLLIPKTELKSRSLGEETFYNVDVIGEVVKDDRLIDNFKYRFDIPTGEIAGEKIPLTVRRYLYPGEYKLVLKVSDGNQNAEGRLDENLSIPERPDAPDPKIASARAEAKDTIQKVQDAGLLPSMVSLLPIAKEIVTGLQRFETKVSEGVRAVDFYLNGVKVMTRTKAPFDADLNMGPLPRKQTIRVVAFGPSGRAVGEDEYIINEGREVFRVRIMTPEKGSKVTGPTKVVAAIAVPEGKALEKMEFYSNENRVATLYQPPWEQTVNIRDTQSLGYVRVVGTLEDGTVSEDLRYVNAPQFVSEVTVDAVELYTTVTEKGKPVLGLQSSNFKVFEDGVIQKIEGFEYVKNLPISVGVLVDTSASMLESLPEAEQAALKFIEFTVGPKDRAFVVSFDNEPYLLAKLTSRKDKLIRAFAGLRAEGSTALYDALVYGLYQFTGVKGKRALVILSDGKDTASKFDFDTTLEYVRKSGISVYGIGLKISGTDLDVKYKLNKIASVTGGQTFYIDSAKNLEAVYRQINEDLRSQYLLTYYSSNVEARDRWRKVEIKVEPSSLQARTISGYYP